LLRRFAREWTSELEAAENKNVGIYIIHVSFDSLPDRAQREYFQEIPTALTLPQEQVDKLREAGGRLLYAQEPFIRLVKDLGGNIQEAGK